MGPRINPVAHLYLTVIAGYENSARRMAMPTISNGNRMQPTPSRSPGLSLEYTTGGGMYP